MDVTPRCIVIAGIERSGKSFWAEKWASACGRPVFLYNAGDDGFGEYKELNFLTIDEQADYLGISTKHRFSFRARARRTDFFEVEGKIYKASDFTKVMHKYRFVKMYGKLSGPEDRAFFEFLSNYSRGIAVVFDDIRAIFRSGLKDDHINFLSRKSHTGRHISPGFTPQKRGTSVALVFHNIDRVNSELWDYTSDVVLFKCSQLPSDNIENKQAFDAIAKATNYLVSASQYEHCIIPLKGERAYQIRTYNKSGQRLAGPK